MLSKKKFRIFNLFVDDIDLNKYISIIDESISNDLKITVCYTNAHILRLANNNKAIAEILNKFDINYVDGYGVKLAAKILNGDNLNRFTLTEYAFNVLRICEKKKWKIFLFGGEQKYIEMTQKRLTELYPNLLLAGALNGFDQLNDLTISRINEANPDILWIGLGTPTQELWVLENLEKLNVNLINCVGDLFTALSGKRIRGPKLLREHGFEWLFRLFQHPIKYFSRYIIGIPVFIVLLIKYKFSNKG